MAIFAVVLSNAGRRVHSVRSSGLFAFSRWRSDERYAELVVVE